MRNTMVIFGEFVSVVWDQKSFFGENLVQEIKIVSLSWNLVLRLGDVHFSRLWSAIPFLGKLDSKI